MSLARRAKTYPADLIRPTETRYLARREVDGHPISPASAARAGSRICVVHRNPTQRIRPNPSRDELRRRRLGLVMLQGIELERRQEHPNAGEEHEGRD